MKRRFWVIPALLCMLCMTACSAEGTAAGVENGHDGRDSSSAGNAEEGGQDRFELNGSFGNMEVHVITAD